MEILYVIVGVPLIIGVILAVYEWRKGRKIRVDTPHDARLSERGWHTEGERIRAEGVMLQNPSSGMY